MRCKKNAEIHLSEITDSLNLFIGRSHNSTYVLFHEDQVASEGLKEFAEVGGTHVLEEESQGVGGIFDEFNAPPISEGVGISESEFFVDGNHSMVNKRNGLLNLSE